MVEAMAVGGRCLCSWGTHARGFGMKCQQVIQVIQEDDREIGRWTDG